MQNLKFRIKFWILVCGFGFWIWNFGSIDNAYALNLEKLKVHFLKDDYKSAIVEGEKILANTSNNTAGLDELYFLLGLSYLKDGNLLRASDIFEIILKEFKETRFKEQALLGLGDTYFLRNNFTEAQKYYEQLIHNHPRSKLKAQVYYRLSLVAFKTGDAKTGKEYLDKLKENFPLCQELALNPNISTLTEATSDFYYAVQVGAFASNLNAKNLCNRLIEKGYDAYIEEAALKDKYIYRVKVGKIKLRTEAAQLENKLSLEGYPTKICP